MTAALTDQEQLLIELINQARLDPVTVGNSFGVTDLDKNYSTQQEADLDPGTISRDPMQPLAPNVHLNAAADHHSNWMLTNNIVSHYEGADKSAWNYYFNTRDFHFGYTTQGSYSGAENIAVRPRAFQQGNLTDAQLVEQQNKELFLSVDHRVNTLHPGYQEIGVGQAFGNFTYKEGTFPSSTITEDFFVTGNHSFLTGVAYDDTDHNNFYSVAEGQQNVQFAAQGTSTTTLSTGGYALALTPGAAVDVTISAGGSQVAEVSVDLSGGNVKLDLVNGTELHSSGDTTLVSGIDNATLLGAVAANLTGNDDANVLTGSSGANTLMGMGGNDRLFGGAGHDRLFGGAGHDALAGAAGNDALAGGIGNDRLFGGWGNDHMFGGAGSDALAGAVGNDLLFGGAGNDRLFGGAGNDQLNGGAGADHLVGGAGNDWASYAGAHEGVKANLVNTAVNTGDAAGDTYAGIENVIGSDHDDSLIGNFGANTLTGAGGNDALAGFGGNDRLFGGAGNDRLFGGAGNDALAGAIGNDLLNGGAGHDRLFGGAGSDRLFGLAGNDQLFGGAGNDALAGAVGNDLLNGGAANDRLFGGADDDQLLGGAGNDQLFGGAGADQLSGNAGNDILHGGAGADTFLFNAGDGDNHIADFSMSDDDTLTISAALIGGSHSVTDALHQATDTSGEVVFSFHDGTTITLDGVHSTAGLADHILITG